MKQTLTKTYRPFIIGILSILISCFVYVQFLMPSIPEHKTDASINYEIIRALHDAEADRQAYVNYDNR